MRKYRIFYVLDSIWIVFFFLKAVIENNSSKTGLVALESLGHFVLYSILCIIGILALVIVMIIHKISIKKRKINR
ncbi:hypothetical protein [Clostridium cellulovorans]|uniref:Uncharacterized protein n=1 Tax=Clostridium cellulovorans (strain ATCC 35296 / DSM 3052 / OCM 3 / 743B) TaxID=573061 RepID=D9SWK9_CLOC7|nr:hypothetical protein [Clostridium cellulovorans]ADL53291.1 hypothetical protein Clocel_3619 [Clostridium cellulovorans 743B]